MSTLDGYIRVSRVGQRSGDSFIAPEAQEQAIRKHCADHGLTLGEIHTDLDQSGGKMSRPAFDLMMERVRNGETGGVIVAKLNRFGRSTIGTLQAINELVERKAQFVAIDQNLDTSTAMGRFVATILIALAAMERERLAEEWQVAQALAIERGVSIAEVPAGYRKCADGPTEIDPGTAPAVLAAFEARANGASLESCRRLLADAGVALAQTTVGTMLANRFYLGELHYGDGVNLTAHPALVTRDLFHRVQLHKGEQRGRQSKSDYLLARQQVLRCAKCDSAMVASSRGTQRSGGFYRCMNRDCEARATIDAETLDQAVIDVLETALAKRSGTASTQDTGQAAQDALEAAQNHRRSLIKLYAAAGMSEDPDAVAELTAAREACEAAQDDVDQIAPVGDFTLPGSDVDKLSLDERRNTIRILIKRISVSRGGAPIRGNDAAKAKALAERVTLEFR